jgi:hypothetical protein
MLVPKLWKKPESRYVFFLPPIFWCSCGGNHPQ